MYMNSISKYKKISNKNIQLFLEENGIYPVKEDYEAAYYKRNPQLFSLLDRYFIRYICIPNKV